ncbi:hypothetical protein HMPREF9622_02726 [Cutibacterium modestum HL037PA3]|nr:hypothetical protein HMPREF9622_02726 [Cutibacterium modestum HL037PA3]EGG26508.1 hypothetical protein PA08_1662 [Cutibacterium modestum P08]
MLDKGCIACDGPTDEFLIRGGACPRAAEEAFLDVVGKPVGSRRRGVFCSDGPMACV